MMQLLKFGRNTVNRIIGGKEVCHDRKVRFTPKQY